MKVVCTYCGADCGEKEPLTDTRVSHCMCTDCLDHFELQLEGLSLSRYLDDFGCPILIVNSEGRMVAANATASAMFGKTEREIKGLLGGEAMECQYARQPEGCGKTVHCETCTIRNLVMHTMETGESQNKVHVFLRRDGQKIGMTMSTRYIEGFVRITIE